MKVLGSILLFLIADCHCKDVIRHKRQTPPLSHSVINKSENGSLNLDPEIERMINKHYLTEFFQELTNDLPWQLTFLIDQRSFLKEMMDIKTLEEFPGIIDFDFDQHIRQKQDIFYPFYLHEQETKKRFKPHHIEDANGFLTVESEKLFDMLNNVFTYPRS